MQKQPRVRTGASTTRWLLLVHQQPASPSRARVKTWRRLQQLGAVAIRNAVYVLPDTAQSREDFEWMKAEIVASRGEASVFAADTIDSLTHDDIVSAFRADRERSYRAVAEDAGTLASGLAHAKGARGVERQRLLRAARQLSDRLAHARAGDFFAAGGREEAEAAVARVQRLVTPPGTDRASVSSKLPLLRPDDYRGHTWLTRPRPGIDRGASAWLIRRFIDPEARFAFGDRPAAVSHAIPFDMYEVEFSHQGERCTFEVLCARFGIADPAVARLGQLVHDLDLKESRYSVPEAQAVGRLIEGLRQAYPRDDGLLEQESILFEALYRSYDSEGLRRRRPAATGANQASTRRKGR